MSKEVTFLIYGLEQYKNAKAMTGKQAINVFNRYQVVDYIISCYGALHTTGANYIVEDIDRYIAARP